MGLRRILERLRIRLLEMRHDVEVHPTARVSMSAVLDASGGGSIRIGKGCEIGRFAVLDTHGGFISLGAHSSVNPFAVLYGHGGLTIGSGVRIAASAVLVPANHGIAPIEFIYKQAQTKKGITVEDDVWIGAGALILDGITLRKGSVIGAGAVVTRSTDEYSVNAGVPARKIKSRGQ